MKKLSFLLISILLILNIFIVKPFADENKKFPDVKKDCWYEKSVVTLTQKGIINGFPDGTFGPDKHIKVDEFIKLLVCANGYIPQHPSGYWAEEYINEAYLTGILLQGEIIDFRREINRGEMSRMIVRSLGLVYDAHTDGYQRNIEDYSDIDARFRDYALLGYSKGIIAGIDKRFAAYSASTRKEACVMVHRAIDESVRVKNDRKGSFDRSKTSRILYEKLDALGYTVDDIFLSEELLTRRSMAVMVYDTIIKNASLKKDIIPVNEEVIKPIVFTGDDYELSDTFYSICANSRSIEQNFHALQIFDVFKSYNSKEKIKILDLDLFSDNTLLSRTSKDISGMRSLSEIDPKYAFDHTRFYDIFSDGTQMNEELCMLYDLGIMDQSNFGEYSLNAYCSPNALVTDDELNEVIERLTRQDKRAVFDEKKFGDGDSWGRDLYGDKNYVFRISELKMIYLYDVMQEFGTCVVKIRPSDNGMSMNIATLNAPYFDDFILILDNCEEGRSINSETTTLVDFEKYDLDKYSYFVPSGYKEKYMKDISGFLRSDKEKEFSKQYGPFVFEAAKNSISIKFKYAYRGTW